MSMTAIQPRFLRHDDPGFQAHIEGWIEINSEWLEEEFQALWDMADPEYGKPFCE